MKRLLVTGSRDWADWVALNEALWAARLSLGVAERIVLVHGAALGVDQMANLIWTRDWGLDAEPHPADWMTHGKRAGYVRNAEMVSLGADLCVAFILNASKGATMCAELAEKAGIPVLRIPPDTPVQPADRRAEK